MKRFLLALTLAFAAGTAQAQLIDNFAFGFSPRTGDAWVDAQLGDFNVLARGNTDGFIDDVVVTYGVPRVFVSELLYERRWHPGDVYYACALAHALGRPCREIADIYQRDHAQGWGVIAQRLGIKPGSAQFHALKGRVERSGGKYRSMGHGPGHGRGNSGRGQGQDDDRGRDRHDDHHDDDHHDDDRGQGRGRGKGKGGG